MGQIISTLAVGVAVYTWYNRPPINRRIENHPPENNSEVVVNPDVAILQNQNIFTGSIEIRPENWAWIRIREHIPNLFANELNKLKILILSNLINIKDLPHGASKAISSVNLFKPQDSSFPVPMYAFPNIPIWYGPYDTVQKYITSQHNPGQPGVSFDTFLVYPFNKNKNFYLVRFTNEYNNLNIDLIRQMYHCLELLWVDKKFIKGSNDGKGINFTTFDGKSYEILINDLRLMYGYYNLKRFSVYREDRFIITEFMKLIEMMNFTNLEIDGHIAGYYYNDGYFHPEFTILGTLQHEVLRKPKIASSSLSKNGTIVWSLNGGGVNLDPTSNLLQIEPELDNKQQLLEMEQPLQIKSILTKEISSTKLPFPGISNSDEFIKIIQDFFNYQYEVELFDISNLELTNIRTKQLELKQKALLLITDKNFYKFTDHFLYLYTIISPVKNIYLMEYIGGKVKSKRNKGKTKRKAGKKNKRTKTNKNKYNL